VDMVFQGVIKSCTSGNLPVRCLLDSGASACFLSMSMARKLGVDIRQGGSHPGAGEVQAAVGPGCA